MEVVWCNISNLWFMTSREAIVMENSPLPAAFVHCEVWLWFYAGFINFNNFHCLLFFKIKLISKIEKMQSLIRIEEMVFRGKLIIQELMVVCFCWIFLQIHVRDKNKYKNKQKTKKQLNVVHLSSRIDNSQIKMFSF